MISNVSDEDFQGEAMGLALSFRTLGDGIICLVGGFLIAIAYILSILLSASFAIFALLLLRNKQIIYESRLPELKKTN